MTTSHVRTTPIRRAGNRPLEFLGGDREIALTAIGAGALLAFQGPRGVGPVLGLVMALGGLYWARKMYQRDPLWRRLWNRSRRYADYYPARATPFRVTDERQVRRYR